MPLSPVKATSTPRSKLVLFFLVLTVIYGIFSLVGIGLYLRHIYKASVPFLYADYFYVPLLSMVVTPLALVTMIFLLRLVPRGGTGLFWITGLFALASTTLNLAAVFTPEWKELTGNFASSAYSVLLLCTFLYQLLKGRTRKLASFDLAIRQPIFTASHLVVYMCYVLFMFYTGFAILGYIVPSDLAMLRRGHLLPHFVVVIVLLCVMPVLIMQHLWIHGFARAWQLTKAHLLVARNLLGITDTLQPVTLSNPFLCRSLLASCAVQVFVPFALLLYWIAGTSVVLGHELSAAIILSWLADYSSAWRQLIQKLLYSHVSAVDWLLPQALFVSIVWLVWHAAHYACHRLVYDILDHGSVWTQLTFELAVLAGVGVSTAWLDDVFSYPTVACEMHSAYKEALRECAPKELVEQLDAAERLQQPASP